MLRRLAEELSQTLEWFLKHTVASNVSTREGHSIVGVQAKGAAAHELATFSFERSGWRYRGRIVVETEGGRNQEKKRLDV